MIVIFINLYYMKYFRKNIPDTVIYEYAKPPRGKSKLKKGYSSLRNKVSQNIKKSVAEKRRINKILENPDILKLAPFSTSLVATGSESRQPCLSSFNLRGTHDSGPTCLKSVAERKAILREFQNLSEALISQQNKFDLAIDRIKDERRKQK